MKDSERFSCQTCNGSRRVVTGYYVVCTKLVENVEVCSDCREKDS